MRREDLLDLNDVLQHPGRRLAVDIATELPDEEDVDLLSPLEGYLEATSTGNVLLVTGTFSARIVVECARCTAPLESNISFEIEEQFAVEGIPSSLSAQDFAKVVADEPFPLFEGNSLIVENLLRQGLLLAIPTQALCEFGWDGPCPVAERQGQDADGKSRINPQFSGLANLLEDEAPS